MLRSAGAGNNPSYRGLRSPSLWYTKEPYTEANHWVDLEPHVNTAETLWIVGGYQSPSRLFQIFSRTTHLRFDHLNNNECHFCKSLNLSYNIRAGSEADTVNEWKHRVSVTEAEWLTSDRQGRLFKHTIKDLLLHLQLSLELLSPGKEGHVYELTAALQAAYGSVDQIRAGWPRVKEAKLNCLWHQLMTGF